MTNFMNQEVLAEFLLSILYLVPVSFFRYQPFRSKLRFSLHQTIFLYFLVFLFLNAILIASGSYNSFIISNKSRVFLYSCMTLMSFSLIKDHIGKQLYVICFYGNFSLLLSTVPLIVEYLMFGTNSNNLSVKCVGMLIAIVLTMPIIYRLCCLPLNRILQRDIPKIWNVLWLVGIIQVLLSNALSIPFRDDMIHTMPNALIRFGIGFGSVLMNMIILYTVGEMLETSDKNIKLESEKQQYMIQEYQYRNIQAQMEESRRFRHDFKHHETLISGFLSDTGTSDSEKIEKLKEYCRTYFATVPEAEEIQYCKNYAVNTLLNYYHDKSDENDVRFDAIANLPPRIDIPDMELCVTIGNLLSNALEGALTAPNEQRQIRIRISKEGFNLLILAENSFDGQLNQKGNEFCSTKHEGPGIGITSIRNIVSKYHGSCDFSAEEKIFTVRIHILLNR